MKALILAGGVGSRLRPLTYNLPKPMIPIFEKPFLHWMLRDLASCGITEAILAVNFLPDAITSYFDEHDVGLKVTCVLEESPLGTAGAVRHASELLEDGKFLVCNGDIFTHIDLEELVKFHESRHAALTIVGTPVENPSAYGVLETSSSDQIERFVEKPRLGDIRSSWINAGTYLMNPEVLQQIPAESFQMFETDIFPALLENGYPVFCYKSRNYWLDIGTPSNYVKLHSDVLKDNIRLPFENLAYRSGIWQGEGCKIADDVTLESPIYLGAGVTIGAGSKITGPVSIGSGSIVGSNTRIENSLIWDKNVIGDNCILAGSILAQGVVIGDGVKISPGTIVGNEAVVDSNNEIPENVAVMPARRIPSAAILNLPIT
jgi:NDP-sugar pyrophosphorylase family protein